MSTIFPQSAQPGDVNLLHGKRYVFDGDKWVLSPLLDEFYNDNMVGDRRLDPSVVTEMPRLDSNGDSVEGLGRDFKHTFTIKELEDLETF